MISAEMSPFGSEISEFDVIDTMSNLNGWEDKYRQVIVWGKELPKMADSLKQDQVKVTGCESQVWFYLEERDDTITIHADSDARIVRGLIAIIQAAANGKNKTELAGFDWHQYFEKLALLKHLSESRSNGVYAIIAELNKTLAS